MSSPPPIPITGVPSDYRVPDGYAELLFGQGPSSAGEGERVVIFVMPKTAAGTWTANTVYPVIDEKTVKDGAGPGSMAHRAARMAITANRTAKYYALPYAASSGGSPATATGTITISGSPTGSGVVEADCSGELCSAAFNSSSTPTTIAAALAAAINTKDWLPYTAGSALGVVTLTARTPGASQGTAAVGVHRFRARTSGAGISVATSGAALGLGTGTAGADGSTTEAANLQTALAVIASDPKYYIGVSMWDATGIGHLKTHLATKAEPRQGMRSQGIAASVDTLAAASTLAIGKNYERLIIAWQKNSEHDPAEIVGNVAGVLQKRQTTDPAYNFENYAEPDWLIKPAYSQSDWPSNDDLNDAINDGLTAIGSSSTGSRLVLLCNTRSKDSGGTIDDFRATEGHRISTADNFVATVMRNYKLTFGKMRQKDDERLADGSVNTNQRVPPKTLTPFQFRKWLGAQYEDFGERGSGLLQQVDECIAGLKVQIDPNNRARMQCGGDIRTCDLHYQATFRFAEISPG